MQLVYRARPQRPRPPRMKPRSTSHLLLCLLATTAVACSSKEEARSNDESPSLDAGHDGQADSGADTGPESDGSIDGDAGVDSGTDAETDADTDSGTDADASTCEANETLCSDVCVDLQSDHANCGTCGNSCDDDAVCTSGLCLKTQVYDLTAANFTTASYPNDCASGDAWWAESITGILWGFSWADSLPASSVIAELSLELGRSMNCNGASTWTLNSSATGPLPYAGECQGCDSALTIVKVDMTSAKGAYVPGGQNTWLNVISSSNSEGLRPNDAWSPGAFARVTVKYR